MNKEDFGIHIRNLRPQEGDILVVHFDYKPSEMELKNITQCLMKLKPPNDMKIPVFFEYPGQSVTLKQIKEFSIKD